MFFFRVNCDRFYLKCLDCQNYKIKNFEINRSLFTKAWPSLPET